MEAELAALDKKPVVGTITKDQTVLSNVAKETEEKADKKITPARTSLQKRWTQETG